MNLVDYLKRTKLQSREDLIKFLDDNFDSSATSWKMTYSGELMDISRMSREYVEEYDDIKVEPVNFRSIKQPNVWNIEGKLSVLNNFDKMSKNTQKLFLNRLSKMFTD